MMKRISAAGAIGLLAMTGCMTTENPSTGTRTETGSEAATKGSEGQSFRINGSHDPADYLPHLADSARAPIDSVALIRFEKANTPALREPALGKTAAAPKVTLCAGILHAAPCWDLVMNLDYNDLRFKAVLGNDVVSSAYVEGGAVVYLCDANNFGGPCHPLDHDIPDFRFADFNGSPFNFNDKVSSFKFQQSDNGNAAVIYDSPNYGGTTCVLLAPFDYNYPPCNMNDRTSSLRFFWPNTGVPKVVSVRDTAGFTDPNWWNISADSPAMSVYSMDNKISSFQW